MLVTRLAFGNTPSHEKISSLSGSAWELVKFQGSDGKTLAPDNSYKYTVVFRADGRVSVRIDCNRGTGTWKPAGPNQLQFGALALTRASCPPAALNDRIAKDWPYVRSYTVKAGHLFLALMADGGTYEFVPASPSGRTAEPVKTPAASSTQAKSDSQNARASSVRTGSTYAILLPEQKRLIDANVRRYGVVPGSKLDPQEAYDNARISGVLPSQQSDIPAAVETAKSADCIILYIGGKGGWYGDDLTEKEGGDTANIDLPSQQVELVNAIAALGKPTVAVVSMGRPQGLASVVDKLPAVLTAYYGGPHQGTVIADAIFGITNPCGKLPYTLPRHVGQVPIHHGQHHGSGYRGTKADIYKGYLDMPSRRYSRLDTG
jgi:heat shock protein HslJ